MSLRTIVVTAALAACLAAAPPAMGAGWNRVTAPNGSSIDQVGLLRTADGTLHLAWQHSTGPNSQDLLHTAISAGGRVGSTVPIQTGWASMSDPALASVPGGLAVLFGGIRTTNPGETNQEMNLATSADSGATWALRTGSIVSGGTLSYGSDASATTLPDGTVLQAWAGTLGTFVHAGFDPAAPNRNFHAPRRCCGYDPGIATDAGGETVIAWYSNANRNLGVKTQSVAPDGSPLGAAATMPTTGNMKVGMSARTPIVARPGGGFYIAYPTGYPSQKHIRLWRVGAKSAPEIARTSGNGNAAATVAAAADGRLWVAWLDSHNGIRHVYAVRSNRAATRFGAAVDAGRAKGAGSAYSVDASAAPDGGLDLLAVFGIGTSSKAATYYTRVRPGLTLTADRSEVLRDKRAKVRFTVTDAGDPVKDVRVSAAGVSGTTDGRGRVALSILTSAKRVVANATAKGYVGASRRLAVRRR